MAHMDLADSHVHILDFPKQAHFAKETEQSHSQILEHSWCK